jgi:hypothetical protein
MHNTLRVDGISQAEPATSFSWKRLTQSKVEHWIQGHGFDLLVASHDGYRRLAQPVTHTRWVFSLRNGIYLVRDVLKGEGTHQVDISWHLSPDLRAAQEHVFRVNASRGLALLPAQSSGWSDQLGSSFWSPAYGQKKPASVRNFSIVTEVPVEFALLLVTLDEERSAAGAFTRFNGRLPDSPNGAYQYASDGVEYSFFFGEGQMPWRQGPVSSDAEFACWEKKSGTAEERLILCNGSYAAVDNGHSLRFERRMTWGELVSRKGERRVFSSESGCG